MAARVTKQDLAESVSRINKKLGEAGYSTIQLRNGYGLWGVDDWQCSNVTPLMSKRELLLWLDGFEEGLHF